ncbi:non-ribosomal peptide synthetase [Nocardia acidivorans]|uniref:non-ribosomal peptide synthetase n=1 Tax=Nocardia acidivorans TaxID=404580 RepID=UPI000833F34D|nr:non-ribosomal peptide synthetase [Nocardia acidivorans]
MAALLAAAVERNPDGIAIVAEEVEVSYRALDARTNQLARGLSRLGVGPEDRVAVALPRSVDSIAAVWAVAKTGAAFVPVDPGYPRARIDHLLDDSGCVLGITNRRHRDELGDTVRWLVVDDPGIVADIAAEPSSPISYLDRPAPLRISNIAYLTYTSGSTGLPKGVAVTHAGLAALCADLRTTLAVTDASRCLHFASPSFDASMLELLLAIGSAATMVIAPPSIIGGGELAAFLHRRRVSHAFLTPSVLATVQPDGLDTLATIVVGGEACPPALITGWATGARRMHNAYGPTETTVAATLSGPLRPGAPVSIGGPVLGVGHRILDTRLRPTATGAVGELYVAGPGLARGYPGLAALTAARFVADPQGAPGTRMYRTGDLVRRNDIGELEYLGRIDHQVNIRGLRIELGEIDAALTRLGGVAGAVTIDRETASGDAELVSFVLPEAGAEPHAPDLLTGLAEHLPIYMVPNSIVVIEEFPRTESGKVDRAALRHLPVRRSGPRRVTGVGEDLVAEVFARVLGIEQLGADTDFFVAGGNSLLATQATARLSEIWKARIPPQLLFDHPTIATLTKAIRSQRFDSARPALLAGLRPQRIPLSPNQLRFWLRNQFDTTTAVDNIGFALRLAGVNAEALRSALRDVVTRHEALRTRYPADADGPYQQIMDADLVMDGFAVRDIAEADLSAQVHRVIREGFDVTAEVPLRMRLLRTPTEEVLVCAVHHICADGSSMAPLAHDMGLAYAARCGGTAPAWRPVAVQYADYALWQRELLGSRDDPESLLAQQLHYWAGELRGLPDQLDLPADRRRPAIASLRGATVDQLLPAATHERLLSFARARQASLFMVMRTALAVLLARLSGTEDIAIGVPMTNRAEPALHGVVGMFVNTTVSRTRVDAAEDFDALLARARDRDLVNFAHADVPFEHVVDAVDPVRSPGRHPLYQVGFAFQNFTPADLEMTATDMSVFEIETDTVKTDLHIGVIDTRDAAGALGPIALRFGYSTDLFDRATVQGFIDAYTRLLESILAAPRVPVGDLMIADHREALRGDDVPIAREHLTAAFARHAAEHPNAVAVVSGNESVTFAELHDRATRRARWLIARGIGPESLVAVAMRRSIEQVITLYAVAEAGAAWVPIDPDHPAERIGYILDSAAAHCVLTTTADGFTLGDPYTVDTLDTSGYPAGPVRDTERTTPLRGDHPAYVIYTSGSTGKPKGVVVTHTAIVNQLAWMRTRYDVRPRDTYLHKTAATFDVSLWGYFLPLGAGARLVLAGPDEHRDPHAICRSIANHRVTLTDFVPTMLTLVARSATSAELDTLRAVFVIGEALAPETAQAFAEVCPAELHNLYGPTEAAVSITEHPVAEADRRASSMPIGVPVWNSQCEVLDSRLHPLYPGVAGELVLAGDQLARGYHRAPGLTAARFVASPFGPPGSRMYRSGDLARSRPDGILEYLGRTDFQVKVRGHRIELGEIESALLDDPAVAQAVVTVRRTGQEDRLIGYVVPRPGSTVQPKDLRHRVSGQLPGYMVPAAIMVLDALPVNTSGKVDRAALPAPVFAGEEAARPSTPLESVIAEVFAEVLDVSGVGPASDFFELGGSSLLIFVLHQRLSDRLDCDVPMSAILAAPTVAGLAAYVSGIRQPVPAFTPATDAILDPAISIAGCALARRTAHDVLLTGATGFLGAHLLHELLTRTRTRIWCLVRAGAHDDPLDRILVALNRFGLPTDGVADRVTAVRGDLAAPRLGLDSARFELLADRIDIIYHNAAKVNHVDPYERLRAANVEGTRAVLELATTARVKQVHFISTLGAAIPAGPVPEVVTENDRLHADQLQSNGYLTSKWVGEELIRQAGARGVPVTIHRPGTICGDTTTGVNNPDDAFWNMVRAAAILGVAPEVGEATVSLVPVDYVVRAIVALTSSPRRETVYHQVNHTPIAVREVLRCLRERGYPVRERSMDFVLAELHRESAARSAAGDDSLARAAVLASTFGDLAGHTRWDDSHTREALHEQNIHCPVIDRTVLNRYLEQFTAAGFLPPVAVGAH